MTPPIAHAGHWLTTVAYFIPVIAFVVWMLVVQWRERHGTPEEGEPEA